MVLTPDRHTRWYQGIQRIYRNAVVKHIRTTLRDKYPHDWESLLQKSFANEWTTIVENADLSRKIGAINSTLQDAADYLSVNHFYNLFDVHFEMLFPGQGETVPQVRKQEKASVLSLAKEIKIVRDPESHPPSEDMDFNDLVRQLDTARRICSKFDKQAADELAALMSHLYSDRPNPIQASLPPRESISPQFIGRREELDRLNDWLRDPVSRVWLLAGDGGKGKTAIAYQFATLVHQQSPEPFEFIIWLSAKRRQFIDRQITDIPSPDFWDIDSALDYILTEYGFPGELPASVPEKKKAALEYLDELPALIVLDDINSLEGDIVNFLHSFFMTEAVRTKSKFLLTSRLIPFGMDTLATQISGFPPRSEDGRKFVESRVRLFGLDLAAFDTQTIGNVLSVTDGSPLYIEDLLRLALLGDDLRTVCAEWRERKGGAARKYALGREFDRLTSDARDVLLATALYNAPVSTSEIAVAAGRDFDIDRVQNALGELQNLFLVPKPRIIEDIPRFVLNQNTRELVLDVTKSSNPDRLEKIAAAIKAVSGGNARGDRQNRIVIGYIRQAVSLVKLERFREAEETLKLGLEALPETPDLYGQLGWVYKRWMPTARTTDARECFARAAELNCTNKEMYYHWCQLEKEDSGWTRMAQAAMAGLNLLKDNIDLEYSAGYAFSRQAHQLLISDQLERAEDEAERAQHHLEKVLIDPEDLEPGQYQLHSMAYQAMALTIRTMVRIATARGNERGTERNLRRLAEILAKWNSEHPNDPYHESVKNDSIRSYPRLRSLLNSS